MKITKILKENLWDKLVKAYPELETNIEPISEGTTGDTPGFTYIVNRLRNYFVPEYLSDKVSSEDIDRLSKLIYDKITSEYDFMLQYSDFWGNSDFAKASQLNEKDEEAYNLIQNENFPDGLIFNFLEQEFGTLYETDATVTEEIITEEKNPWDKLVDMYPELAESVAESFDEDGNREHCDKCGTPLNDGGTCPKCDDGEEDYSANIDEKWNYDDPTYFTTFYVYKCNSKGEYVYEAEDTTPAGWTYSHEWSTASTPIFKTAAQAKKAVIDYIKNLDYADDEKPVFDTWEDENDDYFVNYAYTVINESLDEKWDEYDDQYEFDNEDDVVEQDRMHAALYGGDREYCDKCGSKLVRDEWGGTCPRCNETEVEMSRQDALYDDLDEDVAETSAHDTTKQPIILKDLLTAVRAVKPELQLIIKEWKETVRYWNKQDPGGYPAEEDSDLFLNTRGKLLDVLCQALEKFIPEDTDEWIWDFELFNPNSQSKFNLATLTDDLKWLCDAYNEELNSLTEATEDFDGCSSYIAKETSYEMAHKIAMMAAKALSLDDYYVETLEHDINNLRANEWVDEFNKLSDRSAVKRLFFTHCVKCEESLDESVDNSNYRGSSQLTALANNIDKELKKQGIECDIRLTKDAYTWVSCKDANVNIPEVVSKAAELYDMSVAPEMTKEDNGLYGFMFKPKETLAQASLDEAKKFAGKSTNLGTMTRDEALKQAQDMMEKIKGTDQECAGLLYGLVDKETGEEFFTPECVTHADAEKLAKVLDFVYILWNRSAKSPELD